MEEEKTLVIPLGGSTADGEQVNPTTGPVESAGANAVLPEQRRGKAVVKPTAVNKPQVSVRLLVSSASRCCHRQALSAPLP